MSRAPKTTPGSSGTIEVRTSPSEVVIPLVLFGLLLAALAASLGYLSAGQRLITFAVFAALLVSVGVARLIGRAPRLVISPEHLGYRAARREPLRRVAWSEIQSARIEPALRRTPPRLRLILASSSVLETASSGEAHRYVDIPIGDIDLSWSSLEMFIHRAAPHLFPPSA
jgi:hypothetical protein